MPETSGPIRVLLVLRQVDCNDGVTAYCESLVQGLCERGHRVVILSGPVTTFFGSQTRYESIRARVEDWIVLDDVVSFSALPRATRAVAAAIRRHGVDVISPQGLAVLPLARLAGLFTRVPVVVSRHVQVEGARRDGRPCLRQRVRNALFGRLFAPARYIAISEEMRDSYITDFHVAPEKIALVMSGVDDSLLRPPSPEERRQARQDMDVPPEALVCSLVGRLNGVKGHEVLVDAARKIRRERPDLAITYLFVGEGDERDRIRACAHRDAADREAFRFVGFLSSPAAMRAAYWATDVLAAPSRFEAFGISVVEAMACGCVPIRTRTGGASQQIVEGETGFTIDVGDSDALAARIVDLADPQTRGRMSAAAAHLATTSFGRGQMVENILAVYRSVLR